MSDTYRKLAEEIAEPFRHDDAFESIVDHWEARLRSALPSLSGLLGELAVKTAALSAISEVFGRGYSTPGRFEAALFDLEGEITEALSSDSGRLAGEALRAAVRLADALDSEDHAETIDQVRQAELENEQSNEALIPSIRALLQAFPGLREGVERG